jgi:ferric-dicitrate binding protein FerR (iron transport regulator)
MNKVDKIVLERFHRGECTPSEKQQVLTWFTTPEGQKYLAVQLESEEEALDQDASRWSELNIDSEGIFNRILQERSEREQGQPVRQPFFRYWRAIAASLTGIITLGFVYGWLSSSSTVHHTAYGEIAVITLPDQSTVTLNANSTLRYTDEWGTDQPREVWLEGEAFFSVTHQANHQKFKVHTADQLSIEVLGTEFNVSRRRERTVVVLQSGKIRLSYADSSAMKPLVMKPGELVEFGRAPARYLRKQVDTQVYSSWKSRQLIFDDISLSEIARLLEETYGLEVRVEDNALLGQRFSGSVPTDNVDMLLEALTQILDLKMTRNGKQILFEPNP